MNAHRAPPPSTRRSFLRRLALAPVLLDWSARAAARTEAEGGLRFGLIADVHQDVMHDGVGRVRAFVGAMTDIRPDFVLQLGDFCQPHPRNRDFLAAWNAFPGPRYHVLGNHDMDGGYKREQTAAFFGMPGLHYAFTAGALRCIVLDGNDPGGKAGGYKRFIGPAQLAWLQEELARADRPVLLFVHQPVDDHAGCVENSAAVRAVIEGAAEKIVAVFSGHLHLDYERVIHGVRYIQINSASYWWLNNPKAYRETYSPEIHKAHPYLKNVASYRDPLWALVTVDLARGELVLEGRRTEWVGPDPWARGETLSLSRDELHPAISDRRATSPFGLSSPGGTDKPPEHL